MLSETTAKDRTLQEIKNLPAVRRVGKGKECGANAIHGAKGNRICRKALQPSSQPIELAAFYTPAKQHVPSTYLIALQHLADQHRSERRAPSGAVPWYVCSCQFRTIDALIAASGDILHTAASSTHVKGCAAFRGHENAAAAALSYVYFRVATKQRRQNGERAGSLLRAITMYSI